ncbi:protease [Bacillus solimangrovi]|uniref:Protease n=2 Tax=Bacillus solimangrovi TaxID=1305675 RepID=A0A1E5LFW9_9BACI|nr:protease [Bacillus solimangrovi]
MTHMFEDVEYTGPAEALRNAGHTLSVISHIKGDTLTGKQKEVQVKSDAGIDQVNPEDFDALFIPGGFSPDNLRVDERFVRFVKHFMYTKKPVFAICHGPQLLLTAGTVSGHNMTGYKSIHEDLRYAGANVFDEEVVVCENLVTSRGPKDIPKFNEAIVNALKKI